MAPKMPSKYKSVYWLKRVLNDNCITDSGIEYNEEELKELILLKQIKDADKAEQQTKRYLWNG